MKKRVVAVAALLTWSISPAAPPVASKPVRCPDSIATVARCYTTQDENGALVLAAVPLQWNKVLIVHAHGGPSLGPPKLDRAVEDLERFGVFVHQGYAWVGSTYRRGGYGVRVAAADVDRSRDLFWRAFGRPDRTILHGQSYGGNVAAKLAELHALDIQGKPNYDGVLLTSGVLAGGTRAYEFRADLRAVYQYYCRNLPRPDEPRYPVWQGLPMDSALSRADVENRVEECTGVDRPPSERTAEQARRLKNILAVTHVDEKQLAAHMSWATLHFRDLVQLRLDGLNPFDNSRKRYQGSDDDAALNAGVERFSADPRALSRLAYDADLSGLIVLPTVTVHALYDPTIPFAVEADYARVVRAAGRSDLLVQTATDEAQHSKLAETQYVALLTALLDWINTGARPEPASIAERCRRLEATVPGGCHFVAVATPTRDTTFSGTASSPKNVDGSL